MRNLNETYLENQSVFVVGLSFIVDSVCVCVCIENVLFISDLVNSISSATTTAHRLPIDCFVVYLIGRQFLIG